MGWTKLLFDGRLQWETLVTGLVAIGAAWWTVRGIRDQIRQTARIADDKRKRSERAARAMLPLALAELADYARACLIGLNGLRSMFKPDGGRNEAIVSTWAPPDIPESVLPIFRECLEFMDDAPADALTNLVKQLQIQHSRLVGHTDILRADAGSQLVVWHNIQTAIRDAAETYARGSLLLIFARGGKTNQFSINETNISNSLYAAGCFEDFTEIETLAKGWKPTI